MSQLVCQERNECLDVTVFDDASAEMIDKRTGQIWRMGAVALQEIGPVENDLCWNRGQRLIGEQYAGRFRGEALGEGRVRFVVVDEQGERQGALVCRYLLTGAWLSVEVEGIEESLASLCFPPPVRSASLVLPVGMGQWLREPLGRFERRVYRFAGHGLNMRWLGGLAQDERHGWIAILHKGHADAGVMHAGGSATPLWLRSMGSWQGPRVVRYGFTDNGYVGLARLFRGWADAHGLRVPLAAKLQSRPHLAEVLGGRKLSFMYAKPFHPRTYEDQWLEPPPQEQGRSDGPVVLTSFAQGREIIDDARSQGWHKGIAQMLGWIRGGFDDCYPDSWPPEPALGSLGELDALWGRRDCLVGIADNYADIYAQSPSFPAGIIRRPDGSRLRGGIWGGGQCYLLDYGQSIEAARRNAAHYVEHGLRAIYCDTATAVQLYENYDPAHRMTRQDDEDRRVALLRMFRDQGMVIGSEAGCDFGVPVIDWSPSPARHAPGVSVPLWPLVFHDCHIAFSDAISQDVYADTPLTDGEMADWRRRLVPLMLYGYHVGHSRITGRNWPRIRRQVADAAELVDPWIGRIAADAMVDHRFLTPDRLVERTEWSGGAAMVANFAGEVREVDGVTVPSGQSVIL